jgi:hypothetical protein
MTAPTTQSPQVAQDILTAARALYALAMLRDIESAKLKKLDDDVTKSESALLAMMQQAGISTIGDADSIQANIITRRVYSIKPEDWPTLHAYIARTGEFDLLHKRLSITALREREQAPPGGLPPGVSAVVLPRVEVSTPNYRTQT